jgi:DNA-binding transcriptional LysR family regulator
MLVSLQQSLHGLELTLGSGTRVAITDKALDGAFDLIVSSHAGEPSDRLRSWTLFREKVQVVVPASHRFAGGKSITLTDLDGEPMIERVDCCLHPTFVAACRAADVKPDVRHRASGEDQLQRMVLSGFGIGISPPTIALTEGLVGIPLEGDGFEREVILATVPGRRFSIAADAFVKVARARDWSQETAN